MSSSSLSVQLSLSRLALRAGLLAGALLDSAFALMALGSWLGFDSFDSLLADAASYPRQLAALLVCRAAIQMLACYDRRRFDPMIPITALTLVGSGMAGYGGSELRSAVATAAIVLGVMQLISWRVSRR